MADPIVSPRLHSRFDPAGEAARYLEESLGGRRPSCLLVLGGGEDWLSEAARARLPGSLVISIQLDPRFRGRERLGADLRWYPDDPIALGPFLARSVPGRLDGGVAVVSWKPSERAFPDATGTVFRELRLALEDLTSDAATVRYWSRRWMANGLRNFLAADRYCRPKPGPFPIVVAAAGPSLESALDALEPHRGRFRLWALTSAAAACARRGWTPELQVSTDPGFWADRHFDSMLRTRPSRRIPLAAHLTARISPAALGLCSLALLSPADAPENDLSRAAGLLSVPGPSRGTSAADALALAVSVSRGAVIAAGLDLASRDLRSHCRPYGFDNQVLRPERRLRPGLTLIWDREIPAFPERLGIWRRGRAFDLYAGGLFPAPGKGILRLLPSPVDVAGTLPLAPEDLDSVLAGDTVDPDRQVEEYEAPDRPRRTSIARAAMDAWEAEAEAALSGRIGPPLPARTRRLLYALGGPEAAAFLAETARGIREEALARRARTAVEGSLAGLRERTA